VKSKKSGNRFLPKKNLDFLQLFPCIMKQKRLFFSLFTSLSNKHATDTTSTITMSGRLSIVILCFVPTRSWQKQRLCDPQCLRD